MRNSAGHPESIEPFGLLRADDSRRPAFDAYRAVTTHLRDFKGVVKQQIGDVVAFTFDRGGQTTTVLWTWGRAATRVRVRAIAAAGVLVDELGRTAPIQATGGGYIIDLPGAVCRAGPDCSIGGAPRLLVEAGSPAGRVALIPPATATPTASAIPSLTPSPAPTPSATLPRSATPAASPPPSRSSGPPAPTAETVQPTAVRGRWTPWGWWFTREPSALSCGRARSPISR